MIEIDFWIRKLKRFSIAQSWSSQDRFFSFLIISICVKLWHFIENIERSRFKVYFFSRKNHVFESINENVNVVVKDMAFDRKNNVLWKFFIRIEKIDFFRNSWLDPVWILFRIRFWFNCWIEVQIWRILFCCCNLKAVVIIFINFWRWALVKFGLEVTSLMFKSLWFDFDSKFGSDFCSILFCEFEKLTSAFFINVKAAWRKKNKSGNRLKKNKI